MLWLPYRASGGLIVAIAIVAGLAGAMDGPARAQNSGRVCGASSDRPTDIVRACTAIIQSGRAPASRIAIAYAQRGIALMDMNEVERAFADFTEAIRRDPKHAASYSNRGLLWRVLGDVDRAIADFSQAIRFDPNHPMAYSNRGLAWRDKGDHDRALADFNMALKLDPEYANAYFNRASLWHEKKDYERAVGDLSAAIRRNPSNPEFLRHRCIALFYLDRHDRALADCTEAIKFEPSNRHNYVVRGHAWNAKGDHDRAIADYSEAIKRQPDAEIHYLRGALFHRLRAYDRALADLDEAIRLDPKNEDFKSKRAEIAKDAGASSPVAQNCADFSGGWRRDIDGLVWGIHQSGCGLAGGEENFNYHHSLRGTVSQDAARITIRRTTNATGCVATLTGTARVIDKSHIRVDLSGNGCGLPHNHSESFVYRRVY